MLPASKLYGGILPDYISAHRKLYSCEISLLRLTEEWKAMRDRGELVATVSIASHADALRASTRD